MSEPSLLIVYYTHSGNTERMARAIAEGARAAGVQATVKRVEECELGDLVRADGLALGSPTYFSNVAWQVKKLIDESHDPVYRPQKLKGKAAGLFTSSGGERDARDCLKMMGIALGFHHGMSLVEPGLICLSRQPEGEVRAECQEYGRRLARELVARRSLAEKSKETKG